MALFSNFFNNKANSPNSGSVVSNTFYFTSRFPPRLSGATKVFFIFFLELRRYGNTLDLFSRSDRAGPVLVEVTFHHTAPFLAALLRLHRGWARRRRRGGEEEGGGVLIVVLRACLHLWYKEGG